MTLEIWRQGKREELTATLGDASDATVGVAEGRGHRRARASWASRCARCSRRRSARPANSGLLIEDVSGPAARAGVQAGDVLLAVNGTPVEGVEQVREIVAKSAKSVALLIQRDGNKIFVPVRLG